MARSTICRDGFTVNVNDNPVGQIEILKEDEVVATFECEIDTLKTVGNGLTYQCVDRNGSVTVSRDEDAIVMNIAVDGSPDHKCRVTLEEFNDALNQAQEHF